MACKGKVILEDTESYGSKPLEISKSEEDVMHEDEVPCHIQSLMKEADTVKVGVNFEGLWQWHTLELLKQDKAMAEEVLTSVLKMQAMVGESLETIQIILVGMQGWIDELEH